MNIPGDQRVQSCNVIGYGERLDFVQVRESALPVVRIALNQRTTAGFEELDLKGARAVGGAKVAVAFRNDVQKVGSEKHGEIDIRRLELDTHGVRIVDTDILDIRHEGFPTRAYIRIHHAADRKYHILRPQAASIMKLHALADLEHPLIRRVVRVPRLRQSGFGLQLGADLHQRVID